MSVQEKIDQILNKKFKHSIFSGYDTLDVDQFFDEVIEYLKQLQQQVDEANNLAINLQKENDELTNKVKSLNDTLAQKQTLLTEYESNGYKSVVENARIQKARNEKESK